MGKIEKILIAAAVVFIIIIVKTIMTPAPFQGDIADPIQTDLAAKQSITLSNGVKADYLAAYTVEAVIKSKKKYSDYPSEISEYDLALAWGKLNNIEIDEDIKYSQRGRWYYFTCDNECEVSVDYVSKHSANTHIIHEDADILKAIKKLDEGDHIRLTGYLVRVNFDNGAWTSSLSRTDTGDGACEIMYVTDVELID